MAFTAFRDMKPFPQLMFSVFVILVSFLVFMLVSFVVAIPFFGFDALINLSSINELTDPETIKVLKFFQVVQAIGLFIVPPIILGRLFYGNISEYLFLNKTFNSASIILIFVLMFYNMIMTIKQWQNCVWMKGMHPISISRVCIPAYWISQPALASLLSTGGKRMAPSMCHFTMVWFSLMRRYSQPF